MSTLYTDDQLQIKLLNQLSKMHHKTQMKEKTIILYDFYTDAKEDQIFLHNLHTFAKLLLDSKLKVSVEKEQFDDSIVYRYSVESSSETIREEKFQIQQDCQGSGFDNIWLYEKEGLETRVVVIPIQGNMIDVTAIWEETQEDEEEAKRFNEEIKESGLQGQEMKLKREQFKAKQNQRFVKRCQVAKVKHLKMFKIQAFLSTILEKTNQVSLCCLVDISPRRHKTLEGFQREFNKLFNVPQQFKPQYIVHGYSDKKAGTKKEAQKEGVTTIFSNNQAKFDIVKYEVNKEEYFFPTDNIRTKIYESMQKNENKAINEVVQGFVNNWAKITMKSSLSFATVVKQISKVIIPQKVENSQDPNKSVTVSQKEIKEIVTPFTFQESFNAFMIDQLYLTTNKPLKKFYTPERLNNIQKGQKGEPMIPDSIEHLVFLHFFCKISRKFLKNYKKKDVETKSDQFKLTELWLNFLQEINELINEINSSLLQKSENSEFRCPNMQKFFNFISFTFESLLKIKKITKRDIAAHSELKTNFEQLRFKKQNILTFIINNQNKISNNEPIHYYDLYLLIINQNSNKEIAKDLEYVYLHINELKGYRIAQQYIHDNQKIVEAIKSLALIAEKYQNLNQNRKNLISIMNIQSKLARLLKIVGQEEFAASIYTKNKEYQFAHKAYQMAFVRLVGDMDFKAQKLIEWGKAFEKDFEYDLSLAYYRKAFSYGKSETIKRIAVKSKMDCITRMRSDWKEEEKLVHDKFLEGGDLLSYTNEINLTRTFKRLRVCLIWDEDAECSMMLDKDIDNAQTDSSLLWNNQESEEDE